MPEHERSFCDLVESFSEDFLRSRDNIRASEKLCLSSDLLLAQLANSITTDLSPEALTHWIGDLDFVFTFVEFARSELNLGNADRAGELLSEARLAADLAAQFDDNVPTLGHANLSAKLQKLLDAIGRLEAAASIRLAAS